MTSVTFNGMTFTGENISVKNNVLYVDGHAVMDLKPNTEDIAVTGDGNLIVNNSVVIYGDFKGTIKAQKVIINGEHLGDIEADMVVINETHSGNITTREIKDNTK